METPQYPRRDGLMISGVSTKSWEKERVVYQHQHHQSRWRTYTNVLFGIKCWLHCVWTRLRKSLHPLRASVVDLPKSHGSPWLTDKWRTSLHRNWGHVSIKLRPEQQITARTPPSEQAPANRILVLASVKDLRWAPINDESYFFIRIDSRPAKNLYSLDESTLLDIVVSANLNRNPSHWPKAAATQVALNLLSTVESPREDD